MTGAGTGALRAAGRWTTTVNGARLRSLRRQRGLSRPQLAIRSGISPATIGRLERGQPEASCRTRTLARLAAALGQEPASVASAGAGDAEEPPAAAGAVSR